MNNGSTINTAINNDYTPGASSWPKPISEDGRWGLAGEFIEMVTPETEADPNALLLCFITFAGNCLGRRYCIMAGADPHYANLYTCLVGGTGSGRKGSAMSVVEQFFGSYWNPAPAPAMGKILPGISTGEGLVYEVHDDIFKNVLNKQTQKWEPTLEQPSVSDKRLLFVLSEFAQCLANMRKPDSTLSSIMRTAWDKGNLATPAKNSRVIATGALISILTGISREELLEQTTGTTDADNGTLNRFLFVCSKQSKRKPQGGHFHELTKSNRWRELQDRFNYNIDTLDDQLPIQLKRNLEANELWGLDDQPEKGMYKYLDQHRIGLWGAVTRRAPQMVLRIALIQAAINRPGKNGERWITPQHLDSAAEIWRYCDESARYIFGDQIQADQTVQEIDQALRAVAPKGLMRSEIARIWGGHKDRSAINRALIWMQRAGAAHCVMDHGTGGRPSEMWYSG
jgi:hypothetical protein